jgi:hypothetical protein
VLRLERRPDIRRRASRARRVALTLDPSSWLAKERDLPAAFSRLLTAETIALRARQSVSVPNSPAIPRIALCAILQTIALPTELPRREPHFIRKPVCDSNVCASNGLDHYVSELGPRADRARSVLRPAHERCREGLRPLPRLMRLEHSASGHHSRLRSSPTGKVPVRFVEERLPQILYRVVRLFRQAMERVLRNESVPRPPKQRWP